LSIQTSTLRLGPAALPAPRRIGIIILLLAKAPALSPAQVSTVSVIPEADAFVRSATPSSNYGGAGAIAVSGSAAVNGTYQHNGLFDSLLPARALAVSIRIMNGHIVFGFRQRLESNFLVEAVCVFCSEHKPAEPLEVRMIEDGLDQ
jgi:hypothetical protein